MKPNNVEKDNKQKLTHNETRGTQTCLTKPQEKQCKNMGP